MFEYLKKQPLIGVALAIAAGLALAHVTNRIADDFLLEPLERNLATWAFCFAAALLIGGAIWQRRALLAWCRCHKRSLGYSAAIFCAAVSALAVHGIIANRYAPKPPTTFYLSAAPTAAPSQTPSDSVQKAKLDQLNRLLGKDK